MRRHLLGLIALAFLAWAALVYGCPPLAPYQAAGSMGLRVGLVLGVLWLALPDLHRLPPWSWYVLPFGLLALVYAKSVLVFLVPALSAALVIYLVYRKLWRSSSH